MPILGSTRSLTKGEVWMMALSGQGLGFMVLIWIRCVVLFGIAFGLAKSLVLSLVFVWGF